jgi:hypothetical protein
MPAATKCNQKERQWLAKAKADVQLEISEEERKRNYERDVGNIAAFLIGWAKAKDVKKDG